MKKLFLVLAVSFLFSPVALSQEAVQQQFEGFNLNGYKDGGEKAWDINGDTADIADGIIKIKNVSANAYGDDQDMNVKAKNGTINQSTGSVVLEEDVVITSERGTQLTTDTLNWEREKDLVETKDKVYIQDDNMYVTGTGMRAQPSLKTASLEEDVTAKVETMPQEGENKQSVTITCDGPMELDQARQVAIFNENVLVIEVATGRELQADKIEVFFDQSSKSIQKMVAIGNVTVTQGQNKTFAEQLVYDAHTQKMTLLGKPKLVFDIGESDSNNLFGGMGN